VLPTQFSIINISNPAFPSNKRVPWGVFLPGSFNAEKIVISRDESVLIILGQSTMIAVLQLNETFGNYSFVGWIYSHGKKTNTFFFFLVDYNNYYCLL